jgi:hypothetical protein
MQTQNDKPEKKVTVASAQVTDFGSSAGAVGQDSALSGDPVAKCPECCSFWNPLGHATLGGFRNGLVDGE